MSIVIRYEFVFCDLEADRVGDVGAGFGRPSHLCVTALCFNCVRLPFVYLFVVCDVCVVAKRYVLLKSCLKKQMGLICLPLVRYPVGGINSDPLRSLIAPFSRPYLVRWRLYATVGPITPGPSVVV